jgi:hypothetical protein
MTDSIRRPGRTRRRIAYIFPGTKFTAEKTLPVTWWDGGRRPNVALAQMPDEEKLPAGGSLFIGEGGHAGPAARRDAEALSRGEVRSFEIKKEPGANHYHVWVDAVRANERTSDGFHYAGPLAEAVQLGNVATRFPNERWSGTRPSCASQISRRPSAC